MSKYHFIGIKGSGMSSLAQIAYDMGHVVQGSDEETYFFTQEKLEQRNIPMFYYDAENIKNIIKKLFDKKVYVSDIYHTWDNIPFTCKFLANDEFECLKHTCPDYRLIVEAYDEYLKERGLERAEITLRTMKIIDKKLKVLSPDAMMNMSLLNSNNESFDAVFRRELEKLPEEERARYVNAAHIYAVERYYK